MLILLSGLPGVGKSSLARAFCEGGWAVHLRIDAIEAAVMASALRPASDELDALGDVGYRVAAGQAVEMVAGGHVVVGDAVNADPEGRAIWPPAALVVEVVCSDRAEHEARVGARHAESLGTPGWQAVRARRWVPWERSVLRLDSARAEPETLAEWLRRAMPARGAAARCRA